MKLNIAVQMDALHTIKPDSDTSVALCIEAQKRGYPVYYYQPADLYYKEGKVLAKAQRVIFDRDKKPFYSLRVPKTINLADMDVVLMRQDPPFNMNYLTYTYLLEMLPPSVRVINNPREVRNCPEKLFVCQFAEFMPPTLISRNRDEFVAFRKKYQNLVIKPLYGHGGSDIEHAKPGYSNKRFNALLDEFFERYDHPFIAQQFLEQVHDGDKRIILIDGEPVGALNRIPAKGQIRSNLARGGTAVKTELNAQDKKICKALKPELKRRGLFLVGIDVIGGYLTEINITSPTGLRSINQLNDTCLEAVFWDRVEGKSSEF